MFNTTADTATGSSPYSHNVLWIFDPIGGKAPFAYTVGLGVRPGGYELACAALPSRVACAVLNNAAEQLATDDTVPADGVVLDRVLEGYDVRLRRVDDTSDLAQIPGVDGEQPPVWQVLWPAPSGRFPGERGHRDVPVQRLM
ncbi:DUF4262 domain-containing protein [Streptomyces sp. BH055]|uniref:DUF4262 domain-containing protein n=1 Tax=unclassified Streptomyces TaxID=2593676 RepID=UPI003BB73DCF